MHDPRLSRRRLMQLALMGTAGLVVSDQSDEVAAHAQRGQVSGHISGPADHGFRNADPQDLHVQGLGQQRARSQPVVSAFAPTFGLIAWDSETYERHPKPSLAWLGDVARANALPAA